MKISTLLAALSAVFSCAVVAQTERELESHEHGHALLNVAIDSELLFVELDTPWNNLVGFEHKPGNSEQQALVDNALADLNDPTKLFDFEGTQCTAVDTIVENSASDDEHHDDDEHGHDDKAHKSEEHDEHGHDDEAHKDKDHDEHGHDDEAHEDEEHDEEHADHDDEGETHSEVRVSYSFECDDINKLDAVNVKFFGLWSGFEELDAQLIGPSGQAAAELSPDSTRLDVAQVQ